MDPYVYPGTNVLRNLRGIRDAAALEAAEAIASSRRMVELEQKPLTGRFDPSHLRAVHHYIFQDVYDWAGEFRTVDIGKGGNLFALKDNIASCLDRVFDQLCKERHLAGLERAGFAQRSAYYLGEINAIHPFREGNGRTQREFLRELAVRNGFDFDWARISQAQMIEASTRSFRGDYSGLEELLLQSL